MAKQVMLTGGTRAIVGTLEALDRAYRFALIDGQWCNLDHWSGIREIEDDRE